MNKYSNKNVLLGTCRCFNNHFMQTLEIAEIDMESIIAPAVIAALVSMIGIFFKDLWFDRKKIKHETKILAYRLHYALSKYIWNCACQLRETEEYIGSQKWDKEIGDWCSCFGKYNIEIPDLPIDVEKINWLDIDDNIIISINKLSLDIPVYRNDMSAIWDFCGRDELENTYIEKTSKIGLDTLKIIDMLSHQYDIPSARFCIGDESLKEFFSGQIKQFKFKEL